jgi:hypothetical protein
MGGTWDRTAAGRAGSELARGVARAALRSAAKSGHQGAASAGGRLAGSFPASAMSTGSDEGQQLVSEHEKTRNWPDRLPLFPVASAIGTKIGVLPS